MNSGKQQMHSLSKKSAMVKSQPNILKIDQSSISLIKGFATKENKLTKKRNIQQLTIAPKTDKCLESPMKPSKTSRPISSPLCSKKSLEQYYSTNTTTSRKPIMKTPNQHYQYLGKTSEKTINTPITSTSIFTKAYDPFYQHQQKSHHRLLTPKQQVMKNDNKKYHNTPLFNPHSKTLCSSPENFFTRLKKNNEAIALKKEKLIQAKIKQEHEEVFRKNRQQKHNSIDLSITERIKNFYEWDNKRRNKLEEMKEESLRKELRTVLSRPKINRSIIGKNKRNTNRFIKRLYKEDPMKRKEKKEALMKIFEPTFVPKINVSRNKHSNFEVNQSHELKLNYLSSNTEALVRDRLFNTINKTIY